MFYSGGGSRVHIIGIKLALSLVLTHGGVELRSNNNYKIAHLQARQKAQGGGGALIPTSSLCQRVTVYECVGGGGQLCRNCTGGRVADHLCHVVGSNARVCYYDH